MKALSPSVAPLSTTRTGPQGPWQPLLLLLLLAGGLGLLCHATQAGWHGARGRLE